MNPSMNGELQDAGAFMDRRNHDDARSSANGERRQFGNNYHELSTDARELALAVDQFKFRHRRRFVTYEELLGVVTSLGYRREER